MKYKFRLEIISDLIFILVQKMIWKSFCKVFDSLAEA